MAPHKLPRALVSLLLHQQPSSTTLYYSYLRASALIEVRPWNETGEITGILTRLSLVAQSRAYGLLRPGDVQPTTCNCYLAVISTVFVNHIALLLRTLPFVTLRVSFVLRLRQSFPEDCARLKLSSARASQAGLKEMMTRRRVRELTR